LRRRIVMSKPRVQTVQKSKYSSTPERFEPSSRTVLTGEQPDPWDLLQPQDTMSRHRGAEPCRPCGLLGKTSLLSPG
jgi:hypothetical protein